MKEESPSFRVERFNIVIHMIGLIVNYDELVCESMLIIMTIDKRILLLYELRLVVNTYASSLLFYAHILFLYI
mgnify:CR=1 FL=1